MYHFIIRFIIRQFQKYDSISVLLRVSVCVSQYKHNCCSKPRKKKVDVLLMVVDKASASLHRPFLSDKSIVHRTDGTALESLRSVCALRTLRS